LVRTSRPRIVASDHHIGDALGSRNVSRDRQIAELQPHGIRRPPDFSLNGRFDVLAYRRDRGVGTLLAFLLCREILEADSLQVLAVQLKSVAASLFWEVGRRR